MSVTACSTLKEGFDGYLPQKNKCVSIYTYIHILVVEALNGIELAFDDPFLIKWGQEPTPRILLVFDDYLGILLISLRLLFLQIFEARVSSFGPDKDISKFLFFFDQQGHLQLNGRCLVI